MSARRNGVAAHVCGHCAWGFHRRCAGPLPRPGDLPPSRCECDDHDHEVERPLALMMARYRRPDLARDGGTLLDELVERILADHQ